MPQVFDAHDFIIELIRQNPYDYFAILHTFDDKVSLANAQISGYMADHASELDLIYSGEKHISLDIFRNPAECACYEKR